jgi:hypothetical protein
VNLRGKWENSEGAETHIVVTPAGGHYNAAARTQARVRGALPQCSLIRSAHLCALSQRKQPSKKERKGASVQRSAVDRSRDPGLRFLPREFATIRGCSDESKNIFALLLLSIKWRGGTPMTSIMQASCSTSFSPGNRG